MTPLQSNSLPSRRIGIMGTPVTSGNRGVLALGAALARLCISSAPNVEVLLFGSHSHAGSVVMRPEGKELTIPIIHWRMSPRSRPRDHLFVIVVCSLIYRLLPLPPLRRWIARSVPWIGALETTDIVGDVRGGDSFSDIYGLQRFVVATLPVISVLWVKRDIVLFPQTYGPFKSKTSRWIARWVMKRSSLIVARDPESQRIAQELVGPKKKVRLSPDVAFALYADPMEHALFDTCNSPEPIPSGGIGLNVNGLLFNGGYTGKNMFGLKLDYRSFVTELATLLLSLHPGPLILIPHTYAPENDSESDNGACRLLKASLPADLQNRVKVVTGEYDAHQLKGIIKRCEFFVGSRMHSCIAALSQGVPCVGVAYSMKFRGVFESVGSQDWVVDGRSVDNHLALQRISELYTNGTEHSGELAANANTARQNLARIFSAMVNRTI